MLHDWENYVYLVHTIQINFENVYNVTKNDCAEIPKQFLQ